MIINNNTIGYALYYNIGAKSPKAIASALIGVLGFGNTIRSLVVNTFRSNDQVSAVNKAFNAKENVGGALVAAVSKISDVARKYDKGEELGFMPISSTNNTQPLGLSKVALEGTSVVTDAVKAAKAFTMADVRSTDPKDSTISLTFITDLVATPCASTNVKPNIGTLANIFGTLFDKVVSTRGSTIVDDDDKPKVLDILKAKITDDERTTLVEKEIKGRTGDISSSQTVVNLDLLGPSGLASRQKASSTPMYLPNAKTSLVQVFNLIDNAPAASANNGGDLKAHLGTLASMAEEVRGLIATHIADMELPNAAAASADFVAKWDKEGYGNNLFMAVLKEVIELNPSKGILSMRFLSADSYRGSIDPKDLKEDKAAEAMYKAAVKGITNGTPSDDAIKAVLLTKLSSPQSQKSLRSRLKLDTANINDALTNEKYRNRAIHTTDDMLKNDNRSLAEILNTWLEANNGAKVSVTYDSAKKGLVFKANDTLSASEVKTIVDKMITSGVCGQFRSLLEEIGSRANITVDNTGYANKIYGTVSKAKEAVISFVIGVLGFHDAMLTIEAQIPRDDVQPSLTLANLDNPQDGLVPPEPKKEEPKKEQSKKSEKTWRDRLPSGRATAIVATASVVSLGAAVFAASRGNYYAIYLLRTLRLDKLLNRK